MPQSTNKGFAKKYSVVGCRADTLLGVWLAFDEAMSTLFETAMTVFKDPARMAQVREQSISGEDSLPDKLYSVDQNGIAHLSISGPMSKYRTSFMSMFGGTSTVEVREALQELRNRGDVRGLLIEFDSPGGTLAGNEELGHAIAKTAKMMPVIGHAPDQCCSAAMWAASQCHALYCGAAANVGSVGVISGIYDTSKRNENSNSKLILVTTGKYKGMGADGQPVTEEHVKELQRRTDEIGNVFWKTVESGRPMVSKHKDEILTARVFLGADAVRVGLADAVGTREDAYKALLKEINNPGKGVGGPSSGKNHTAAIEAGSPPARSRTMLTSAQLTQARALPGGASITEENADSVLLDIASTAQKSVTDLTTKLSGKDTEISGLKAQIPQTPDKSILRGHGLLCHKQIDLMTKEGKLTPAQATPLKDFFMKGTGDAATFNVGMLTPAADGKCGYETLLETFELNKPNGLTKDISKSQPAPLTEPGKTTSTEAVTSDREAQLRAAAGLPPKK